MCGFGPTGLAGRVHYISLSAGLRLSLSLSLSLSMGLRQSLSLSLSPLLRLTLILRRSQDS